MFQKTVRSNMTLNQLNWLGVGVALILVAFT